MIHLRPSSSYRWTRCAASASFEADQPEEPPSDEAREGTAAAWVADCVLRGDAFEAADLIGRTHTNGHLVTLDMAFHVQKYIDAIRALGGSVSPEQFVRLNEFIAGTLDSSIVFWASPLLRVKDLKFGFEIVEPYLNTQLLIYTGAELIRLGFPAHITHVEMSIFQPRAHHPDGIDRKWTITVAELWQHIAWIIERGTACQQPNPIATPGPHCDYCRAAASCVALGHSVYKTFAALQDTRQKRMNAAELALELTFLDLAKKLIEARRGAIVAEGEARIKQGENVPGWTMKPTYGHRQFTIEPSVIHVLTGVDPVKKITMSPAELEREGVNPDIVNKFARAPIVAHKLKPVTARDVAKAFGDAK